METQSQDACKRTWCDHLVRLIGGICLLGVLSASECVDMIDRMGSSEYIPRVVWDEGKGQYIRGSCFTAETQVTLADGSFKAISEVRIGDQVLGRDGAVNRVYGIETPYLGNRYLYGFNGEDGFVTAEHPFLTPQGWQSIDPQATRAEGFWETVDVLTIGDDVAVLGGEDPRDLIVPAAFGPEHEEDQGVRFTAIRSIEVYREAPDTNVYNLLLDGDHTYYANGYLVHNKDPGRR